MNPIIEKNYNPSIIADIAPINTCPSELIKEIFSYLSFDMLRAGCLTCKKWEILLNLKNNSCLWKQVVFQQDVCCSKLWSQYLGKISVIEQNSKMHDPALRLKEMGFVGLSAKGEKVIRTILAERCSPLKEEIKKRSTQITNIVLVCGPSGTGKTLLVRLFSSLLNCDAKNIKILSGPKIYNKWKERAKVDIEKIFAKTLQAAQASTNQNETFLLVIDEIDAILSRRSKMHSAVNKFLLKMNKLRNVYNILVIGMTNNLEKIDEAITKSEIGVEYIETTTPNLQERKELLQMYTLPLVEQKLLATDIDFDVLAQKSAGLIGANIQAFVKKVAACTMKRMMESLFNDPLLIGDSAHLTMNDLCLALNEAKI